MKAYYTAATVEAHFKAIQYYELNGRRVMLILGNDGNPVLTAIDCEEAQRVNVNGGGPVHEVIAILELKAHRYHDETLYSEIGYWQSEAFKYDAMRPLMRANLAARCDLPLIGGERLAEVTAHEAERLEKEVDEIMTQHRETFLRLAGHGEEHVHEE